MEQLVEEHRRELLRSAEEWRLAHRVQMPTPKRRRWIPPLPWCREPVRPAPSALPLNRPRYESGLGFLSGVIALDADGTFLPGTFEEEAARAWQNVAAITEALGCAVDNIVYVQCVLSNIDNYEDLNAWWRRQFPDISTAPARFTFQAGALPFGAKVEIQVIAARGS